MQFKRIKRIPIRSNSDRSLILRQQFAVRLIELLKQGKNIINCDETWIAQSDYRRSKWCPKDSENSLVDHTIKDRVSMIAALDMKGKIYYSLLQTNTNQEVFKLFVQHLVEQLDQDDCHWRKHSVLMLDNASYHSSNETLQWLSSKKIPVIFTGSYSFEAAPCELLFSQLKKVDLNPNLLNLGKK